MYKPQNTKLSTESYAILNAIRNEIGGQFRDATPIVKEAEDAKAYGYVVMGSGDFKNVFATALINRIASVVCFVRSYQNSLAKYKRGKLDYGEVVENVWVNLVAPAGYTQSVEHPGDVFKTNNPETKASFHPVNSKLVYTITVNDNELSMAFTSSDGMYNLVERIVGRLNDSDEWDTYILTKYMIARAFLDNAGIATETQALTSANADEIVKDMKAVSNDMRFMNTEYNIQKVATHTPIEDQIFMLTAKSSATIDVGSLARAFNLPYVDFIGQSEMINTFEFTEAEEARLNEIMTETAKQGLIPGYTPITEGDKQKLEKIVGAIVDRDFYMIFDRLYEMTSQYDPLHLNTNSFLHHWAVYSYNPFANVRFFVEP